MAHEAGTYCTFTLLTGDFCRIININLWPDLRQKDSWPFGSFKLQEHVNYFSSIPKFCLFPPQILIELLPPCTFTHFTFCQKVGAWFVLLNVKLLIALTLGYLTAINKMEHTFWCLMEYHIKAPRGLKQWWAQMHDLQIQIHQLFINTCTTQILRYIFKQIESKNPQ